MFIKLQGKWVYDEFNLYESGESFYSVDYALEVAKIFLQKDEYELGSQTYEEVLFFKIYCLGQPVFISIAWLRTLFHHFLLLYEIL